MADGDLNKALKYAFKVYKTTLPLMKEHRIPITPDNYAIWYQYAEGHNKELNDAIANHIGTGKPFTLDDNKKLVDSFARAATTEIQENHSKALGKIQSEMKLLVQTLVDKVQGMQAGANSFSGTLAECQDSLTKKTDIETIDHLISTLIDHTQRIEQDNTSICNDLNDMSKEVDILQEDLQQLILDDPNPDSQKSAFQQHIETLYSNYQKNQQIFSLLIVDIDHFKKFNETYSHKVGDKVLAFLGTLLKRGVKNQDIVVRYGAVNFAIMLPTTDYEGAMSAANRLCEKVGQKRLTMGGEFKKSLGNISISIGLVLINAQDSIESLVSRAESSLQLAKTLGRNQAVGEQQLDTPN